MHKQPKHIYEFGPFRLDAAERLLLRDGLAVPLTPKAFDTLLVLVENSGHLMDKDELMKQVWPETFVEEGGLTRNISALRKALVDDSGEEKYIETVPKRGYRFTAAVREVTGAEGAVMTVERHARARIIVNEEESGGEEAAGQLAAIAPDEAESRGRSLISRTIFYAALSTLVLAVAIASLFYLRRGAPLTERDSVLLADFDNRTGDEVFDETLVHALAVQLDQSPFLNIFPNERVRETLRYMNRSPDERVTKELAREICERQGLKAMLTGSIVSLGTHYVITLEALNAQTGDVLSRAQAEADSKEQVLQVFGTAAAKLRERLGESLASIQKFNTPIEQATTSSLEALRAFSLAREQHSRGKYLEAIPLYKRAIELDLNFALAYNHLSAAYANTRQSALSAECSQKAFELRERVSEREKLLISASYYSNVTREADKAIEANELLTQTYPRSFVAHNNLANQYFLSGQYEKAIYPAREAIRLNPASAPSHALLASAFTGLNRFDEAKEILDQAVAQKADNLGTHTLLYSLAFMKGDGAGMQQQLEWAKGRPDEYLTLEWQAKVANVAGQLRKGNELYQRAIAMALQRGLKESASVMATANAVIQAHAGACKNAQAEVASGLAIMRSRLALSGAACALTLCGETGVAQPLMEEMERQYSRDTWLIQVRLPTARALAEIHRGNPAQAIQLLQAASRYDLAAPHQYWPLYVRGLAYLRAGDWQRAMVEFQKILDNPGVDALTIRQPLARLGLARAAALAGDTAKSRKSYDDFFSLWKDADPDIPILQEAKREYAKLK